MDGDCGPGPPSDRLRRPAGKEGETFRGAPPAAAGRAPRPGPRRRPCAGM